MSKERYRVSTDQSHQPADGFGVASASDPIAVDAEPMLGGSAVFILDRRR